MASVKYWDKETQEWKRAGGGSPAGSVSIDPTLTKSGAAADAKVVGDKLKELSGSGSSQNGEDGFSPIATVTQTTEGATISITDKNGTTTATVTNGKDGKDGTSPVVSVSNIAGGHRITITDVNGTKTVDVIDGSNGKDGYTPVKGVDYFTDADKAEIAEQIEGATLVQAPTYVNSVEKMTNTGKVYVLAETGHIWVYMDTTAMQTVTDDVDADYEYPADSRLGSDGSAQTSGSYAGYTITPFIDLLAYPVPFTLHMEGMAITPAANDSYTRMMVYDESQTKLSGGNTIVGAVDNFLNVSDSNVTVAADGSTTILFTTPPKGVNAGTILDNARYARFSGKITTTPNVYVTYETEVTGGQWVDTGTTYAPTLTEADKQAMVDEVAAMVDTQLLDIVGDGVVTV